MSLKKFGKKFKKTLKKGKKALKKGLKTIGPIAGAVGIPLPNLSVANPLAQLEGGFDAINKAGGITGILGGGLPKSSKKGTKSKGAKPAGQFGNLAGSVLSIFQELNAGKIGSVGGVPITFGGSGTGPMGQEDPDGIVTPVSGGGGGFAQVQGPTSSDESQFPMVPLLIGGGVLALLMLRR